jgi:chromosome segregation ATPase
MKIRPDYAFHPRSDGRGYDLLSGDCNRSKCRWRDLNLSLLCGAQKRQNPAAVKYWQTMLAILASLSGSVALAEDFKTNDGKEYKNATVTRVEPDGIIVKTKSGISKLYFTELPKDVQEQFHYNPEKAAAAQQAEESNKQAKQAGELQKQQQAASRERQRQSAEQQANQRNLQALVDRLAELQQQEENLLAEIGKAQSAQEDARRRWVASGLNQPYSTDPAEANLPLLRGRLDNVRDEKERVRRELERAQRELR